MMLRFNSITPQTYTPHIITHHPFIRVLQRCNPYPTANNPPICQRRTRHTITPLAVFAGYENVTHKGTHPTITSHHSTCGLQKCNPQRRTRHTITPIPVFAGYKNVTHVVMGVILSEAKHDKEGVGGVDGVERSRKGISPYYPKLLSLPCLL